MKPLQSIAFIGNHLPRRCGIATFTHDLHAAVASARPNLDTGVVAMTDPGGVYDYPEAVRLQVRDDVVGQYVDAASFLNRSGFEVVCLQHEFGIFGGAAGEDIVELLSRLDMPVVTTLHTVLAEPTQAQRDVMARIAAHSAKLIVMADKGRALLGSVYGVPDRMIEVIPHGIPDFPFLEPSHAKARLGFQGKMVILTFGLLSPSKGIETVIDALPEILRSCPNAVYVVLGATHPNLVRNKGEAYRTRLKARAAELGVSEHIVFIDQFVDQATLLDYISMCDVYATPYRNEAQMTSGTLAYSFGLGKAVVSTPYWHATELLAEGRGILVPFEDTSGFGSAIAALLKNDIRRHAMRKRAYADSRSMTWGQTAMRYLAVFEAARGAHQPDIQATVLHHVPVQPTYEWPAFNTSHLLSMCDSTGLLQHAVHCVPDRAHGYCVDDNARALLLACSLGASVEQSLPEPMISRFAAFIQHAWNPDTRRFRNFMSYDRRWLEDRGSEDSHGRTLWALGQCALGDGNPSRRQWAAALFKMALPTVEAFHSPRAWAFTLMGLDAYGAAVVGDTDSMRLRAVLTDRLMAALSRVETDEWGWFEETLAYDNARLPQALMLTGIAAARPDLVASGLKSMRWLMALQSTPNGMFRPVGTDSFGAKRDLPQAFDQQPVEAAATISACILAWRLEGSPEWIAGAKQAFEWFLGRNDLGTPLVDAGSGSCRDGLHRDRANQNRGAESVLAYLMGRLEIDGLDRAIALRHAEPSTKTVGQYETRPAVPRATTGGPIATIAIREAAELAASPRPVTGRCPAVQAGD